MFGFRKYVAVLVAMFVVVLIACETEIADCDENSDRQEYEACLVADELRDQNGTATAIAEENLMATMVAEAVAYDALSDEDHQATTVAIDAQSMTVVARNDEDYFAEQTATAASGGSQTSSGQITSSKSSASATVDLVPEVLPSPVVDATPVPTSMPVVTMSTPTAVPAPTATEVPTDLSTLSWLTAKQAAQLALMDVDGEVYGIVGHGTSAAGLLSSGDTSGSEPSPGAGYSRDWSVTVRSGNDTIHCSILIGDTLCNGGWEYDSGVSEVGSVQPDSPDAFQRFESANNADWQAMMANDDVSILFELYASAGESLDDPPFPVWSAWVTVHDLNASPGGGQFSWNIETDTITSSVY